MKHSAAYYKRTRQLRRRVIIGLLSVILVIVIAILARPFAQKTSASTTVETYKYYTSMTIESGDTLTSIAKAHMDLYPGDVKDYVSEVMYINSLSTDTIYAGNTLYIPYYSYEMK